MRTKKFTTKPVMTAAATVPSRTPTSVPMVENDTTQAMMTQLMSKPTFV